MECILRMLIICVIPVIVTPITISSNGNSPEIKMFGRAMINSQQDLSSSFKPDERTNKKYLDETNYKKINSTKLAINERYRRLIPYMTFYYANDLPAPSTEAYSTKSIEVEKAQILEAGTFEEQSIRRPKVIHSGSRHHSIPRYQGNRLTHFNIASANPTKVFYNKDGYPVVLHNIPKGLTNYHPLEHNIEHNDHRALTPKEINGLRPSYAPIRKQYLNQNQNENENVQYYFPEREEIKYKLVPYQQTPPIKNKHDENINNSPKYYSTPSPIQKDTIFVKPRPRPQYHFDEIASQHAINRKPPATISEVYFERQKPVTLISEPVIETGFKPIVGQTTETSDQPTYTSTFADVPLANYENDKPQDLQQEQTPKALVNDDQTHFQYVTDQPSYKPQPVPENSITLAQLLNSLQLNKSIPKLITKENVGSSIRILLQALNTLKGKFLESEVTPPVLSSPAPFVVQKSEVTTIKPIIHTTATIEETDLNEDSYLAEVENPSQHLDDYTSMSQQFPLPISSDEEGGTPGRPGLDYPILTTIPSTKFDCKTQRYKGFFADPETRCQVWHYCDLNGGQASFLCPNGTIFSQAALTCDWWFNVKCSSTAQLYVLNESLYKYILPHSPKFPEDYSGPLVDKYLTLKFKEMEEEFKKNKNKHKGSEKIDGDEDKISNEDKTDEDSTTSSKAQENVVNSKTDEVSKSSVIVATSGASGNVERLEV